MAFRLTRPLAQALRPTARVLQATPTTTPLKATTGQTGLKVHRNAIPALKYYYNETLSVLSAMPEGSVYRQGVEALTQKKLGIVNAANGDITAAESQLEEGVIEESIKVAQDELSLAKKMLEWKAWEPLEEKPEPGQWEYFGQQ
ncbi:ETC complex I subunit conserved region-domain-containing protein [Schizophyllum fasciatum]